MKTQSWLREPTICWVWKAKTTNWIPKLCHFLYMFWLSSASAITHLCRWLLLGLSLGRCRSNERSKGGSKSVRRQEYVGLYYYVPWDNSRLSWKRPQNKGQFMSIHARLIYYCPLQTLRTSFTFETNSFPSFCNQDRIRSRFSILAVLHFVSYFHECRVVGSKSQSFL